MLLHGPTSTTIINPVEKQEEGISILTHRRFRCVLFVDNPVIY
jgi:hypothetical protein